MRILESALYAEDLVAAKSFYVEILGLPELWSDADRHLFLRCEDSVLILFKPSKTLVPDAGVPPHGAQGPGHLAFSTSHAEIEAWRIRLKSHNVPIIAEVNWPNGAHSIYFRDTAGNVLEFATADLYFS